MIKSIIAAATVAAVSATLSFATASLAFALDISAIEGTYMQNVVCKGDATDDKALKVTISAKEIVSNIGVCTILDSKQTNNSFNFHVECKFPAGPLIGDITFTPQPNKTVKFVDRDGNYNAVLHRCLN